jgi:predicted PurR-regulated permease PerM
MITASPLNDQYDNEIINRLARAIKSVIGGTLVIALLQGILTGVGFWLFGIPLPFIWGSVGVIVSLIPSIGIGLINVPAAIYLFVIGSQIPGILMLIWGLGFVGMIDNFLRPLLLERGTQIHPLLILFSVLGGISLFGPIGFITGPLVMTLISEFMNIYRQLVLHQKARV